VKVREERVMVNLVDVRRHPNGIIHHGLLNFKGKSITCCLGRSGITTQKREGDGATPVGIFKILYGYYRADRITKPKSLMPLTPIETNDGWCDDVGNPNYNSFVKLPFPDSHEVMTRNDRLYDVCIVLDYNIHPKIKNKGSAIFFHQTSLERKPTEGCVAIDPKDMQLLLPFLSDKTFMRIHG